MKIGQNLTRNPMDTSDLAYHAWFKSCASFFENVSKACSKLNTSNLSLVACSGYPIMDVPLETYLFDMSGGPDTLNSGEAWGCFHEIDHNVQDSRWTPTGLGETTCNIFAQYVNE